MGLDCMEYDLIIVQTACLVHPLLICFNAHRLSADQEHPCYLLPPVCNVICMDVS